MVGGQLHAPAALSPVNTRYPLYWRLGRPQGQFGRVRKISPLPEFDHRTVHPVANLYADWAIPALMTPRWLGNTSKDVPKNLVASIFIVSCVGKLYWVSWAFQMEARRFFEKSVTFDSRQESYGRGLEYKRKILHCMITGSNINL